MNDPKPTPPSSEPPPRDPHPSESPFPRPELAPEKKGLDPPPKEEQR